MPTPSLDSRFAHLGLMDSTQGVYHRIADRLDGADPVAWYEKNARGKARGTLMPMHATTVHVLVAEHGLSEDEASRVLPRIRGRRGAVREGLDSAAMHAYLAVLAEVHEPVRTLLRLLPYTGLRISEACGLGVEDVQQKRRTAFLVVRGKGDRVRRVPLPPAALTFLAEYLREHEGGRWLFPGRGGPITPAAVRKVTRRLAADYPDLAGLCPHRLRHTYATQALRRGADIRDVQSLLGHTDIKTTSRYLHPTDEDLAGAVRDLDYGEK